MNKMTLIHIGIFTAGVAVGWMLANNQKRSFANLTQSAKCPCTGTIKCTGGYCVVVCDKGGTCKPDVLLNSINK